MWAVAVIRLKFFWNRRKTPFNESINEWMNQSINQSMNQWINQSMNQSINQSINQSVNSHYFEDNQLVIFDVKNISRGCVVRRWKNECAARVFLTPYDASEWDIFHIKNNQLIILLIIYLINIIIFNFLYVYVLNEKKKELFLNYGRKWKWKLITLLVMISKFITLGNSRISLLGI